MYSRFFLPVNSKILSQPLFLDTFILYFLLIVPEQVLIHKRDAWLLKSQREGNVRGHEVIIYLKMMILTLLLNARHIYSLYP
jgi:hypothetical protein